MLLVCHRVTVPIRQCGDPIAVTSPTFNPDIHIFRVASATPVWYIYLPDGTVVSVSQWGNGYLNVGIYVSQYYFGTLAGLCGSLDGNWTNDLAGRWGNCSESTSSLPSYAFCGLLQTPWSICASLHHHAPDG